MHSDRSKSKAYEQQKAKLETVAIEVDCHDDEKVRAMVDELEKKVVSMNDVMKQYKKLVFKAEAELKKDCCCISVPV